MIAVDTNVLVRLLVRDDPRQVALAEELIRDALEAGETCLITDPVLCELEWVLESAYGASRDDLLATFQRLLGRSPFAFEDEGVLRLAIEAYAAGKADLSDYLLGARARARQARTTFTFDRSLRDAVGFTLLTGGG